MDSINQIIAVVLFYPTLFWNLILSRLINNRQWWNEIDQYVLLGAIPFSKDVKKLKDSGVGCIINLCAESTGPVSLYKKYNMEYYHIEITDFTCPSIENIRLGVSTLQRYVEEKKKVYIHCKAGRGRSATIVFCWMVKHKNYNAAEAMHYLLNKRGHINKHIANRIPVKRYLEEFL